MEKVKSSAGLAENLNSPLCYTSNTSEHRKVGTVGEKRKKNEKRLETP